MDERGFQHGYRAHHHGMDLMNHRLYLTAFSMYRFLLQDANTCDSRTNGKPFSSFMMVLQGEVSIETDDEILHCGPGDMVYMPDGLRYVSNWKGCPEIEFAANYFRFQRMNPAENYKQIQLELIPGVSFDRQFALQKIDGLSNERTKEEFVYAWEQSIQGPAGQMYAMSYLYRLFAENMSTMKKQKTESIPSAILPAVIYMERNFMRNDSVGAYAEMCHMSESHFYHLFQQAVHLSPVEFRNKLRVQRATMDLMNTDKTVEDISQELGFVSSDYFRRVFKSFHGVSPRQYRTTEKAITL